MISVDEQIDELSRSRSALVVDWQYYCKKASDLDRSIKAVDQKIGKLEAEKQAAAR